MNQKLSLRSWSKSANLRVNRRPVVESLEQRQLLAVDFDYALADRFGIDLNRNGRIDLPNTAQYAQPSSLSVTLSVLGDSSPPPQTSYRWELYPAAGGLPVVVERSAREIAENPPRLDLRMGNYDTQFQRIVAGRVTDTVRREVSVRDLLIVSLGDSYGSGEGNPEVPQGLSIPPGLPQPEYLRSRDLNQQLPGLAFLAAWPALTQTSPAQWADGAEGFYGPGPYDGTPGRGTVSDEHADAHRSTLAATAQYALRLEREDPHTSVTYVQVAQSGATILSAIGAEDNLGKETGSPLPNQIEQIRRIVGSRPIDQLFVSLGGNDIGFVRIVTSMFATSLGFDVLGALSSSRIPGPIGDALGEILPGLGQEKGLQNGVEFFQRNAPELPARFAALREALDKNEIVASSTYLIEYPDPTRIMETFVDPSTGQESLVPSWGPVLFDIIPGVSITATTNFGASELIVKPLNQSISEAAAVNGWSFLGGVSDAFIGHGYAAPGFGRNGFTRFIRTFRESVIDQGPVGVIESIGTTGTLHPNANGHRAIAERIYEVAAPSLAPRTSRESPTQFGSRVPRQASTPAAIRDGGPPGFFTELPMLEALTMPLPTDSSFELVSIDRKRRWPRVASGGSLGNRAQVIGLDPGLAARNDQLCPRPMALT